MKKEKKTKNLKLERLDDLDKSTVVNNAYETCVQDMQGKAMEIKIGILNNGKNVQVFNFATYVKQTNLMMNFTNIWLGKYNG